MTDELETAGRKNSGRATAPAAWLALHLVSGGPLGAAPPAAADTPGTILDATPRELAWFENHCVLLADPYVAAVPRICRVNVFRTLGTVGGRTIYFALYRRLVIVADDQRRSDSEAAAATSAVDRPPFNNTAVVIFEATGERDRVQPILARVNDRDLGAEWFAAPRIVTRDGRTVLVISRQVGSIVEEEYWAVEDGRWVPVK